jgi:hypothetical protein
MGVSFLEALGTQHRVDQVDEERDRYDAAENGVEHRPGVLSELLAGQRVEEAAGEEGDGNGDEHDVEHGGGSG